jgi:purine-binding chemotaxis protein CheW
VASAESESFLLCRIGTRIGALSLADVWETMRPLQIEPFNAMPPFVLGLAIVRGVPIPVLDAGKLLMPASSASSEPGARFVTLKLGERSAALAVDEVLEVRSMPRGLWADIPPLLREVGVELVSAIGALDSKLLLVLKAARLVPNSVWSAIPGTNA